MSNIRKVDLNLLLALSILLEECSVSRSAERLKLTQPTVSNMLARLRELFDDPLFTRTRHGLVPTSRALELEPELRAILGSVDSLVAPRTFDPATSEATVTLSSNEYIQFVLLVPALVAMAEKAPNMRFAVRQAEIEDLVALMEKGTINIAVTIPEFSDPRLRQQSLYREEYVVVFRLGDPLGMKGVTLKNFLQYDHVIVSPTAGHFYGPTDEVLAERGLQRRVTLSVSSFFSLIGVVESSDRLALIPKRLYQEYSDRLQMAESPVAVPGFEVIAVWNGRTHDDPLRQWVVDQLREAAVSR
jgi:DNA-binding transcriptional LysR family regulator